MTYCKKETYEVYVCGYCGKKLVAQVDKLECGLLSSTYHECDCEKAIKEKELVKEIYRLRETET